MLGRLLLSLALSLHMISSVRGSSFRISVDNVQIHPNKDPNRISHRINVNAYGEPLDPSDAYDECYNFLLTYMPERDVAMMSDILLNNTITYALFARNRFSYASSVPWDIFLNNVLPYMVMNEARDHWRQYFYQLFGPVADQYSSYSELSVWMANNMWTTKPINVTWKSDTTPLSMSVFEVLQYGYASCTGHSIALVAALRSIGIPARVAGTIWNTTCTSSSVSSSSSVVSDSNNNNNNNEHIGNALSENHSWFEIYDENGDWSFCNANSCGNGFNKTWFYPKDTNCQTSSNSNYTIYATSYQSTGLTYVLPWAFSDDSVNAYDVTDNYHNYTS